MVGSAGNAPVRHFRLCFLTPDLQSGSRITSLAKEPALRAWALCLIWLACLAVALDKPNPLEELRRGSLRHLRQAASGEGWWVTLPHQVACKAGALLVCHDPKWKLAGCLRAARSERSFGNSTACWRAAFL